jgi:hypothetical protein
MGRTCKQCHRVNPREAVYCYNDGALLDDRPVGGAPADGAAIDVGSRPFAAPFIFPSGRSCHSFNQLALACHEDPPTASSLMRKGYLEALLAAQGRADLAAAARAAGRAADRERGLDEFLGRLPATVLPPARLRVGSGLIDLGTLRPGEDRRCDIVLHNEGMRLLSGSADCGDCPWLSLGDGPVLKHKLFQCFGEAVLPVRVVGRRLGAFHKPQEAEVRLESNGGNVVVTVRVQVPVQPFPEGVLAGARSPRQLAEKARDAPRGAAALIESGAVTRWYEANGWKYPVPGPTATGPAAVQQLFEALGLVKTPTVELSENAIQLRGDPGATVEYALAAVAQENRAAVAHGTSDQPWLRVGPTVFRGRMACMPLTVSVPTRPGETLRANVSVTANGNQRFVVPVTLVVGGPRPAAATPVVVPIAPAARPALPPTAGAPPPPPPEVRVRGGTPGWQAVLPAGLLALVLLAVVLRDYLAPAGPAAEGPAPELDAVPRIDVRFHEVKRDDDLERLWLTDPRPTMRFGLVTLRKGKEVGQGVGLKRLTFDPWGRTNNTCLRFDGTDDRLFGGARGRWEESAAGNWKDEQGNDHDGVRSVWVCDDHKVQVTQFVELVRGAQSDLLDTCRVRYGIENRDGKAHGVGLRFLLDTYIGGNDGVPFTIPGESDLCDTSKDLPDQAKDKKLPDFLQALEKPDLAHPGTVAHLRLRVEQLEPPARVTLGAWPNEKLRVLDRGANGPSTLWDVPVLPMKALDLNDSAVVLYWKEQPLGPGASREVGFEYGLWSLAGTGGRLAATVDGVFRPGGALTVVAYVNKTGPEVENETVTLSLSEGFQLLEGEATQPVPAAPRDARTGNRPVTWKVRAGPTGNHQLAVKSSAGPSQTLPVQIRSAIFD